MKHYIFVLIIFFISCKEFKKEIPKDQNGKYLYSYRFMKIVTEKSIIKNIENGIDSICIRFWFSGSFRDTVKVLELKNQNNIWVYNEYALIVHYKDFEKDLLDVIMISTKQSKPKSEWKIINDSLFKLGIHKLSNDIDIPNYTTPNHGNVVRVELASKNYYRLYDLPIIQFGKNEKIEEAQKGSSIIHLIEEEFGFNSKINQPLNQFQVAPRLKPDTAYELSELKCESCN